MRAPERLNARNLWIGLRPSLLTAAIFLVIISPWSSVLFGVHGALLLLPVALFALVQMRSPGRIGELFNQDTWEGNFVSLFLIWGLLVWIIARLLSKDLPDNAKFILFWACLGYCALRDTFEAFYPGDTGMLRRMWDGLNKMLFPESVGEVIKP